MAVILVIMISIQHDRPENWRVARSHRSSVIRSHHRTPLVSLRNEKGIFTSGRHCGNTIHSVCNPVASHKIVIQDHGMLNNVGIRGKRNSRFIVRSDVDDGDMEDEPLDIDASLDIEEPNEPEPDEDIITDAVPGNEDEIEDDDTSKDQDDEEWYKTLTSSFVVDEESNIESIQSINDPKTDSYVAAANAQTASEEAAKEAKTSMELDQALADITKEIAELKTELSDSEEEFENEEDDDDDWFRTWPGDESKAGFDILKPPRPGEVDDANEEHFIIDESSIPEWRNREWGKFFTD
eukprot:jgi/Bigna1/125711/aug1.1_g419